MGKTKRVTITVRFGKDETLSLRLCGGLFRKVSLYIDGKFEGFFPLTKIINRIRKRIVKYFEE